MYISRLVVRNFRNFLLFDAAISPGVTCILGENNTGKTNLLHALRLALDINLPSGFRQLTENDVHCCTTLSNAQQVLVSVELADYRDKPEEYAFCGLWEIDENKARITYRFRPRQTVREAIERGEKQPDSLVIDDYRWELTGGKSAEDNDPASVEWNQPCGQAVRFQELQAFKIDFLQAL
jgi:putative ATP-dependent endonuclease of OLD family